jgi:hypothetical protein
LNFKCRFIIEKINGTLKNFKALDNIRNTQVGHIQIDYRIACAMINFTHKPCCPDGNNAQEQAKKIKRKSRLIENNMEHFLSRRFNTKKSIETHLCSIEDFPKLSIEEIQNEIIFGSFQLRQSKSYIDDMVANGKAFIMEDNHVKTRMNKSNFVSKCRVLGFEITSRHKRSEKKDNKIKDSKKFRTTYKVFIRYLPNTNNSKAIKGKMLSICFKDIKVFYYFCILSLYLQLHVRTKNNRLLCSCCNRHLLSEFCKILLD